jgi:hypothetical protein
MRLIKTTAEGQWCVYLEKDGEKLEGRVRRVPALKAKEIENRHLGRKRTRTIRKGATVIEHDVEKSEAVIVEKADFALVELRGGWELPAEDVPAIPAAEAKDGFVRLDPHWSNPEVRAQAFAAFPALALWALEQAGEQEVSAQEDEEGKGRS